MEPKEQKEIIRLLEMGMGMLDMDVLRRASGLTALEFEGELFRMKRDGMVNIHSHQSFPVPGRCVSFTQIELIGYKPGVIKDEQYILKLTAEIFNAFISLETVHPADNKDMTFHINAIQNILYARKYLSANAKKEEVPI